MERITCAFTHAVIIWLSVILFRTQSNCPGGQMFVALPKSVGRSCCSILSAAVWIDWKVVLLARLLLATHQTWHRTAVRWQYHGAHDAASPHYLGR